MIAFVPLGEPELEMVMRWRADPEVTRWLFTDITPDLAGQHRWFARISADPRCAYWLIRYQDRYVGLANLSEIDQQAQVCNCGFYIGDPAARRLGGAILPGIVNHVFGEMGFGKIWGEVMAGNTNIIKLHHLLGYREVGVLTRHIYKYGQHHDLHLFELNRQDWEKNEAVFRPYRIPLVPRPEDAP